VAHKWWEHHFDLWTVIFDLTSFLNHKVVWLCSCGFKSKLEPTLSNSLLVVFVSHQVQLCLKPPIELQFMCHSGCYYLVVLVVVLWLSYSPTFCHWQCTWIFIVKWAKEQNSVNSKWTSSWTEVEASEILSDKHINAPNLNFKLMYY
jgi:hypothetical protein